MTDADVIDTLAGIRPGSKLDAIRARRAVARDQAQASYRALFEPAAPGDMSVEERFAVACFVVGLHGDTGILGFYAERLAASGAPASLRAAVEAEAAAGRTQGPFGHYPAGPLSREDTDGMILRISEAGRAALGPRLAAAFAHVHMLIFHPRDAAPPSLQSLLDAGWSATGIVTLSQIVAFLSFQIRVVSGFRVLAGQ